MCATLELSPRSCAILTALFLIETDYIATLFYPNLLNFERCWILGFAALWNTLKPACSAAEHRQTNFLLHARMRQPPRM